MLMPHQKETFAMDRRSFCRAASALALVPLAVRAADGFPGKPVRVISPYAAGGGPDVQLRQAGPALGEALGQSIVIENRVGANGVVGVAEAAKAAPDGYTIVVGSSTTMAANKFLYKAAAGMDPLKEFVPLAILGTIDFAMVVPAESNYKALKDLVADAKANPGKLSYGFGSSAALLFGEMFNTAAGINITKVPYKGTPQSLTDLAAGRLQLVCEPLGTSTPLIKAGKLRALAVTTKGRHRLDPTLPTMAEAGVPMEHETWAGFFAPAGTPREIVQRLSAEIVKAMGRADVQPKIIETGFVPKQVGSEEFGAIHRRDFTRMEQLIKGAGMSPE
jgi:tripartite-type tricarboxylate transporter receptor subunit TctC